MWGVALGAGDSGVNRQTLSLPWWILQLKISISPVPFSLSTDDDCTDSFTPNQVARMHCYLDLVYQQWSQSQKPTPIPIPPMVVGQTSKSLTIHWLPPISGVVYDR